MCKPASPANASPTSDRATPKPVTPASLEAAALAYLERFACSAASLRRVLVRRIDRAAAAIVEGDGHRHRAEALAWVEALIERYRRSGLIDDSRYALMRAASLHRRGASAHKIAFTLTQKGVDRDIVAESLGEKDEAQTDAPRPGGDVAAACAFVRRRRLGPYRAPEVRETYRQRDLGSLARAGFSRRIAEATIGCKTIESLSELEQSSLESK